MGSKYLYYFALLSFLRQMTAHMFQGDRLFRGYWSALNFEEVIELLAKGEAETTPVLLEQLRNCCKYRVERDTRRGQPKTLSTRTSTMFHNLKSLGECRGEVGLICQFCGELPDEPHAGQVCISQCHSKAQHELMKL